MPQALRCEVITWGRFVALTRILGRRITAAGLRPDLIVAIERGGYMPARLLSDMLGVLNIAGMKIEHYHGTHKASQTAVRYPLTAEVDGLEVLVVDDVSDSGDTFQVALEHLRARGRPALLRTATLHHKISSRFVPDFYAGKVLKWRWIMYPWAVVEDLSTFIADMQPRPEGVAAAQARLREEHGIRIGIPPIEDALRLLDATGT